MGEGGEDSVLHGLIFQKVGGGRGNERGMDPPARGLATKSQGPGRRPRLPLTWPLG
jgi:hypothetical protein